jgi:ketosteroid isomerase-like protein
MSQENVRKVEGIVGNLAALFDLLAEDVIWDNTGLPDVPPDMARRFEGKTDVVRSLTGWVGAWEEFAFDVLSVLDAGDSVVLEAVQTGRGKASGIEMRSHYFNVWTFRDGKIVFGKPFWTREEALAAAAHGASASAGEAAAQLDRGAAVLERLNALVGEWTLEAGPPGGPPWPGGGRMSFEWLEGKTFLIQRWHIDLPEAPDGIAIIGLAGDEGLRQHYFDARGVQRIYEMTLDDGVWKLWRDDPNPFPQRFTGTFDEAGDTISARWEKKEAGSDWSTDFDMTYRRVR